MQPKPPLLQKCLQQLEALPDFSARVVAMPYATDALLADGQLILQAPERQVEYIFEMKSDVTDETVETITDYLLHLRQKLSPQQRSLLITSQLPDDVVDQLIAANIEFVDAQGNLHLHSPGNYVLIRERSGLERPRLAEITVPALQVIYGLLQAPEILRRDDFEQAIVSASGVLSPTVGETLSTLERLNYLQRQQNQYRMVDYIKLLERWEMGYAESLRSKLWLGSFTPVGDRTWSAVMDEIQQKAQAHDYWIGGELGGAISTDYLRPIRATLHVPDNYRPIFVDLKIKPSPQGEITFLRQFGNFTAWNREGQLSIADPLLIHAELQMSHNSRLRETAARLFDQYLVARATHA
jgi:hypothetical protein